MCDECVQLCMPVHACGGIHVHMFADAWSRYHMSFHQLFYMLFLGAESLGESNCINRACPSFVRILGNPMFLPWNCVPSAMSSEPFTNKQLSYWVIYCELFICLFFSLTTPDTYLTHSVTLISTLSSLPPTPSHTLLPTKLPIFMTFALDYGLLSVMRLCDYGFRTLWSPQWLHNWR